MALVELFENTELKQLLVCDPVGTLKCFTGAKKQ